MKTAAYKTLLFLFGLLFLCAPASSPAHATEPAASVVRAVVTGVSTEPGIGGCLLVFSQASQSAPKLGFIVNGDEVQVHEVSGFFSRVTCAKFPQGGWVWNTYLRRRDDQPETISQGPEPILYKALKDQGPTTPPVRDPQHFRQVMPQAAPGLVASLIQTLPPAASR